MKLKLDSIVPATFVAGLFFLLCLTLQTHGISGGDSGDLVAAAATFGVAHPPGYPLYTWVGFLLTKLSLGTPAFSVAFLSSLPHTIVLFLLIIGVKKLTNNLFVALYSAFTLGSTYLFLFYSVTPEVFALLDLFVILLLVILYKLFTTRNKIYFYLGSLVFGLSLTHHHLIVILLPPLVIFFLSNRQEFIRIKKLLNLKIIFISACLFIVGLLPYAYAYIAGANSSMINWNKPDNLENLFQLVSRADYGTFQSGNTYGELPTHRFFNVKLFFQLLIVDFGIVQIILLCLGGFWLFVKRRLVGVFLFLVWIFYGPVFFFYASFPILNSFMMGTFERFLLPNYLLSTFFIGCGVYFFVSVYRALSKKYFHSEVLYKISYLMIGLLLLIIPLSRMKTSYLRMQGMNFDYTANNLGRDILAPLKQNAILLLVNDTPLFTTQYMRYAENFRPDTKVFHAPSLTIPYYHEVLKRAFPELVLPNNVTNDSVFDFISLNKDKFPIYANLKLKIPEGNFWIPKGLVFELATEDALPTIIDFASQSTALASTYQNPRAGILDKYPHLMLEDIVDVYAFAYNDTGKILLQGGLVEDALSYFNKSIELKGDMTKYDSYKNAGIANMMLEKCIEAEDMFKEAKKYAEKNDPNELNILSASLYNDCFKDPIKAREYHESNQDSATQKPNLLKQWR